MANSLRASKASAAAVYFCSLTTLTNGFANFQPPLPAFVGITSSSKSHREALNTAMFSSLFTEESNMPASDEATSKIGDDFHANVVRAPLKFVGPYPSIGLRFPHLSTSSQRERNVTGVSLDFVIDTAANTNTINGQVAQELELPVVGQALPGVGSAGYISGGETFELGDTQLEFAKVESLVAHTEKAGESIPDDIEDDETVAAPFLFMKNLTASALPVASPSGAGLLSLAFLYCFQGGVEFNWGSSSTAPTLKDGMISNPPSIGFYGEHSDQVLKILADMTRVNIEPIPVTNLPSVTVSINGVEMKALLDTGSPITVLNKNAAKLAGIDTYRLNKNKEEKESGGMFSKNPFSAIVDNFQQAQEVSKAAARGELLTIAGSTGQPVNLFKSKNTVQLSMPAASGIEDDAVEFGDGRVYVGELPGLAALNGLGVDSPPAVVLGMDALRLKERMFLRAQDNEVYFS